MYCTVKEIIREVLDTDVPDSECVFAVVLTRGDVRHIAQDWNLPDDELETVMQRLDDAFEHGADVSVVHDVVRELMEEKRVSHQVTVPAVMLEKVMALAGSEMKRLSAGGGGLRVFRRHPVLIGLTVTTAPPCAGHHRRYEDERIFQNTSGTAGRLLYPRTGGSRCRTVPERLYRG